MVTKAKKDRISFRLDKDIAGWVRKAAAKRRVTVSVFIRGLMLESFEERHAK